MNRNKIKVDIHIYIYIDSHTKWFIHPHIKRFENREDEIK